MCFGAKEVVKDLSFTVARGEIFGFLGANGAGKTTTIRTLLSLLDPTSGTLLVEGERYNPSMSAMIGYLPEERGLYRNEPVIDTMVYFAALHGMPRTEATEKAHAYLDRVGLGSKANNRLVGLSGGEQQKVQIGTTILHEPQLMILDEPTEALDPVNRSLLFEIINEQRQKGSTVMLVTHRMEEVEQLCDRILLLKDGKRALYGTVDEVREAFGAPIIALSYSGTLPTNGDLYSVTKQLPHYAELTRNEKATSDEIFRFLAGSPDLHLTAFEVRRQTLNDIFVALYEGETANNG